MHHSFLRPVLALSACTALLSAQTTITFTDGLVRATAINTSEPNSPTTLALATGAATQSGVISGPGSVVKTGAGTLSLSGANTYTGGTQLSAGTLVLTNAANLGTGALTFTAGTLRNSTDLVLANAIALDGTSGTFDASAGYFTLDGTVSGTGALIKTGGNLLTLNGTQTYTGATTVSSGSLKFNGTTATSSITLNGVATKVYFTSSQTYAGDISGTGILAKEFSGTTILTGNATHTGGTSISTGTIQIGNGGTTGSLAGNVTLANNGVLAFNRTDASTFSGAISGTGSLTKSGAGTLTLSGANTYTGGTTLAAGTLALGSTDALGTAGLLAFTGGTLEFSTANTSDYSSRFSSADNQAFRLDTHGQSVALASALACAGGTLTKLGTGYLTLSGANTYTGATTISAGTLQFATQTALYNNVTANWTATNLVVNAGATAAFNVGGPGEFTAADIAQLAALGSGSGGFQSGSTLALDTTHAVGGNFAFATGLANPNSGANALALTKLGTGTLTLSGTNTYTGGTTISAGTLTLSGTLQGNIQSAAGTTFTIETTGRVVMPQGIVGADSYVGIGGTGATAPGIVLGATANFSNAGTISGGRGGTGGNGIVDLALHPLGGVGGTGGVALAAGAGSTLSNAGSIIGSIGGTGGNGVRSDSDAYLSGATVGGVGGTGGTAVGLDANSALTNTGAVTGGVGGTGGLGAFSGGFALTKAGNGGAGGTAISLGLNSSLTNLGHVTGGLGGQAGYHYSLLAGATGNGGTAVIFAGNGTLANGGTIAGGNGAFSLDTGAIDGTQGGSGGSGVVFNSGSSLVNTGSITGGNGAMGSRTTNGAFNGDSGTGGAAITASALTATNSGLIVGGDGAAGQGYLGYGPRNGHDGTAGGIGLDLGSGSTLINASGGTILGGDGGNGGVSAPGMTTAFFGAGGAAIRGSNLTVVNSGTLTGGTDGTGRDPNTGQPGTSNIGNAIVFTGGTNSLELRAGSTITGQISGNFALSLGGTANASFDASLLGTQYLNVDSFTKTGASTWTLSGTSTYTGPTAVNAGTLLVNGSLANTAVTVNSGATLGGGGFIAGITTVNSDAHLAPGNSPGTLTFSGGLTLTGGSILDFELGTVSDLIVVSGGLLSGPSSGLVTFNLTDSGGFTGGNYTLINYATASGTVNFGAERFTLGTTPTGYTYSLAVTGNTLQLTATASAIPEPATYAALFGSAALGLAAYRRRRAS